MRLGGRGVMGKKSLSRSLLVLFSVKAFKKNTLEASHIVLDWS